MNRGSVPFAVRRIASEVEALSVMAQTFDYAGIPDHYIRKELGLKLGASLAERLEVKRESAYDIYRDALRSRHTATVIVLSTADLDVLLSRAYEAGRCAR